MPALDVGAGLAATRHALRPPGASAPPGRREAGTAERARVTLPQVCLTRWLDLRASWGEGPANHTRGPNLACAVSPNEAFSEHSPAHWFALATGALGFAGNVSSCGVCLRSLKDARPGP